MPLLILAIGAIALFIDMPNTSFFVLSNPNGGFTQKTQVNLGLDLTGGFSATYRVAPGQGTPSSSQMETLRSIIEKRVNTTGAVEPIIETLGTDQILVQIPNATDPEAVEKLVGKVGDLRLVLLPKADYGTGAVQADAQNGITAAEAVAGPKTVPADDSYMSADLLATAQFSGRDLDTGKIAPKVGQDTRDWVVGFGFNSNVATEFENWTAAHVGERMSVVLDGKIISSPTIQGRLSGGEGVITGGFTKASATQLADILTYGALPFVIEEIGSGSVPASLGTAFLHQTLFAGAIGIGLVMLFMLVFYRLPGFVACLALCYYALVVLAMFKIVPVTLTLAGIAAFVISVGMAVDANILIFERTKEELRAGKTLATAVEAGFQRAWNSILDSNVSSLITACILYFGGSSIIKGFAPVLIIGVATSMFTAVTVSRTLLRSVIHLQSLQKAWLFGVSDAEFQARAMGGRLARRETRGRV
jgi:preprotein translocase subunit SecD